MIQALIEDNLEEPNCSFTQAADFSCSWVFPSSCIVYFVFFIFRVLLGIGTLGCKVANLATIKTFERQLAFVLP
jgi:hypothetical protein